MLTALEMEYAAASVGVAFSINPSTPGFVGLEHFPPSV